MPEDMDRVRKLISALKAEYGEETFNEFISVRTVERLLEGRSVRWGSVIKMGQALGLRRMTLTLVRDGEWERAATLDNEPHVNALILALRDQEAAGRNREDPESLPKAQGN